MGTRWSLQAVVMTEVRIQSHGALRREMKEVASGKRPARRGADGVSFDSVETLFPLLTHKNRELLAVIRDKKPQAIAELAETKGRKPRNVRGGLVRKPKISMCSATRLGEQK